MNSDPLYRLLLAAIIVAAIWVWRRERAARRAEAERFEAERKRLEAKYASDLRERTGQLETLLNEMPEALIALNRRDEITLANRAAVQLFNLGPADNGRLLHEVLRQPEVAQSLDRLAREREVRDCELLLEKPVPRQLRLNATKLSGQGGALLLFHDLTTLRRLESTRQDFVANVSHELRTPISLIKSAIETLQDGAKGDSVARDKFLGIIDRHASRLELLIEDLLLLSALDSGRIELRTEPVDLTGAVQTVIDDLAPTALSRGVQVVNQVGAEQKLRADPLRLRQILSNLIDNAIKYGREAGTVEISATPLGGGFVQVRVRDDGEGMSEATLKRVFERFFRADKARARQQGGTGLGLAIVKNLVLAHGGDVRVESAPGKGSIFIFRLPAA